MKKQFNNKLSFTKETVANLAGRQMEEAMGGNIATGARSICICAYTDRCPTTNYIVCVYTCNCVSQYETVCGSNPCC